MNAVFKVSIPASVQNTIKDLKEITGSHSEEEIYAMLKDCSMDPNETAQKLLLQDTFHEVKRKKRKENIATREPAESRFRSGIAGRGNRVGRGNYSPRFTPHDAGMVRNITHGKQNGIHHAYEKVVSSGSPFSHEAPSKEVAPIAGSVALNGPCESDFGTSLKSNVSHSSTRSDLKQTEVSSLHDTNKESGSPVNTYSVSTNKKTTSTVVIGGGVKNEQPVHISRHSSNYVAPTSNPARSNDSWRSGGGGATLPELETRRNSNGHVPGLHNVTKLTSGGSVVSGKMQARFGTGVKGQVTESALSIPAVSYGNSATNRLSGYSNRAQHAIGPSKVASKEWKPKPVNPRPTQMPETTGASCITITPREPDINPVTESSVPVVEVVVKCLQQKLKEVHIGDQQRPEKQHVIIPDHLHVPESERNKLSFGSIDAWFGVGTSNTDGSESSRSSTPLSEASQEIEETVERPSSSNRNSNATAEDCDHLQEDSDHRLDVQSPKHEVEHLSSIEADITPSIVPEDEPKQEASLPAVSNQYPVVQTSPGYNFGFTPPVNGSQISSFESTDPQARDMTRLPSFVVPQPFDPSTYYGQLYRSNIENDGRISPFHHLSGVSSKYNNNMAMLSAQASLPPQEGGTGTSLVTQGAGVMQSSIPMQQQPLPVLRQPAGMHVSHYQHNYIPYGHYFSPFYFPPPAIHQFLNNGAFPQQPQPGNLYPTPAASVNGVKYALSQYKPGGNLGNSAVGMMGSYCPFGSAVSYNPSSLSVTANSASNEDLSSSQFKESNVYSPGQQNEGSAMWIAAPGREMAGMQSGSFYNIPPPQGQHVTYAPTQGGHAAFSNIYHPNPGLPAPHPILQQQQQQQHSQTMAGAAELGGGPAGSGMFQPPQHTQMNWPNSY